MSEELHNQILMRGLETVEIEIYSRNPVNLDHTSRINTESGLVWQGNVSFVSEMAGKNKERLVKIRISKSNLDTGALNLLSGKPENYFLKFENLSFTATEVNMTGNVSLSVTMTRSV